MGEDQEGWKRENEGPLWTQHFGYDVFPIKKTRLVFFFFVFLKTVLELSLILFL